MVVDDERDVVTLIKFLLEKSGHTVSTAYNGAEALKALGIEPETPRAIDARPDLIVLDVMMPIIDGITVAGRIEKTAALRGVPVIILSAKGQIKKDFKELELKTHFLEKPFDPKKLRQMIDILLKGDSPE